MAISVESADKKDMESVISVLFDAYGGAHPYLNAIWPRNLTMDGQEKALHRIQGMGTDVESSEWKKAIDTTTGDIIGVAMWRIYRKAKPKTHGLEAPPGTWENETEKDFARELYRSYVAEEETLWRSDHLPIMTINAMAVAREHQHRGVGTLLMNSVIEVADNIGAMCTVVSTDMAQRLYKKAGFVVNRHVTLQVSEKFENRPKVSFSYMYRKRQERREKASDQDN